MVKKTLILIFFITYISGAAAYGSESIKISTKADSFVKGKKIYLPFEISIKDKSYIYGNPKGPGIGKPTIISIDKSPYFTTDRVLIEKPDKYYPEGDLQWIWQHKGRVTFYVPLTVKSNLKDDKLKLKLRVEALLCSNNRCTPILIDKNFSLKITENIKSVILQKPENMTIPGNSIGNLNIDKASFNIEVPYNLKARYSDDRIISGILQAILFGIIAGLILNFMPCVLPVLSLKLMSIIKQKGNNKSQNIKSSLAYSGGVFISFLLLASLAAFAGQNWGFLFQNSYFLIFMILIVFSLALSLLGVYKLLPPTFASKIDGKKKSNIYVDSLSKGLLATLLATPCSGPLLGTTLTWTLSQPVHIIYAVFISIAFGMSLPFLVIGFKPGFIKFIPEPGEWIITLEKIMGFLLIGTVIYLINILPVDLWNETLWVLFIGAIGLWQYGKWGNIGRSIKSRIISRITFILLISLSIFIGYFYEMKSPEKEYDIKINDFTLEKLETNRKDGRITIVQFTASWCSNCVIIESTALFSDKTVKKLKNNKIELLKADITRKNPEAEAMMKSLNTSSIPFLAIFPYGEKFYQPLCLRDLYSEDDVIKAIDRALEESEKTEGNLEIEKIEFFK